MKITSQDVTGDIQPVAPAGDDNVTRGYTQNDVDGLMAIATQKISELMAQRTKLEQSYDTLKAQRDALLEVVKRQQEELRLIRMKDCDAVYDVALRLDVELAIAAAQVQA